MNPLHQKMEHPTNNNAKRRPPPNAKRISISIFVISFPFLYLSLLHVPPSNLLKDTTFWFLLSNSIIIFIATTDSTMFSSSGGSGTDLYDEYVKHCKSTRASLHNQILPVQERPGSVPTTVSVDLRNGCYRNDKQVIPIWSVANEAGRPEEVKYIDQESRHVGLCLQQLGHDQVLDRRVDVIRPKELSTNQDSGQLLDRSTNTSLKDAKFDRSRSEVAFKNRDVARKKSVRRSVTEKRICRAEESEYWKMSNEELNKKVEEFIRKFNREIRLQA